MEELQRRGVPSSGIRARTLMSQSRIVALPFDLYSRVTRNAQCSGGQGRPARPRATFKGVVKGGFFPRRVAPYPTLEIGPKNLTNKVVNFLHKYLYIEEQKMYKRSLKDNLHRSKRSYKTTRDYEDEVIKLNTLNTRRLVRDMFKSF
ncbi:hypothetical protein M9H77_03005 [Catharanthus roseus]|uniref:Uncharacterized protein n=1 Tax=Catharanthus roseus TaxID=4058 RepID=A0ACC0CAA4_CATRO|nr:hypothetical protein M9H77_03005 [Catharanthus roseus]